MNLNVHLHMLIPDGVYTLSHGKPRFHAVSAPSHSELTALLNRIVRRITRQLTRDRLRNPVTTTPASTSKPFTVARDGFSLNAAVSCQAHQRTKLERLCRYVARPPLALERLSVTDDGKLHYALKRPYSNGTTHFLFDPQVSRSLERDTNLLAKLAALVPRPRVNLTRYHGVFAPNSKLRARLVPGKPRKKRTHKPDLSNPPSLTTQPEPPDPTRQTWAQRRVTHHSNVRSSST